MNKQTTNQMEYVAELNKNCIKLHQCRKKSTYEARKHMLNIKSCVATRQPPPYNLLYLLTINFFIYAC